MVRTALILALLAAAATACKKNSPEPAPKVKSLRFAGRGMNDTVFVTVNGAKGFDSAYHGTTWYVKQGDNVVIDYRPKNDTNYLSVYINDETARRYNCVKCVTKIDTIIGK